MSENNEPPFNEIVQDLLGQLFHDVKGSMLVKWNLTAEVLNSDGVQSLTLLSSPDIAEWDLLGMMHYAQRHRENVTFVNNYMVDDE